MFRKEAENSQELAALGRTSILTEEQDCNNIDLFSNLQRMVVTFIRK